MRFNPFKLADRLIERNYEIPIFDSHVGLGGDDSFMTTKNSSVNLGEYLNFLRAWSTSDRTKKTDGVKHCPFCGGEAKVVSKDESASSDGYHRGSEGFVVECVNCGAENGYTRAVYFNDFTKRSYADLDKNVLLRIKECERYNIHLEDCKKESIDKWNKRKVW